MTGQSKEKSTKKKQVTAGLDEIIEPLSSLKLELILKYLVINELDCINVQVAWTWLHWLQVRDQDRDMLTDLDRLEQGYTRTRQPRLNRKCGKFQINRQ